MLGGKGWHGRGERWGWGCAKGLMSIPRAPWSPSLTDSSYQSTSPYTGAPIASPHHNFSFLSPKPWSAALSDGKLPHVRVPGCATDQLSWFSLADSLVCRVSSFHPSPQTPDRQERGSRAQMAFLAWWAGIRILVMVEALWLSLEVWSVCQCPQWVWVTLDHIPSLPSEFLL